MLTNLPMALMYTSGGQSGHMMSMMLATTVLVMLAASNALQVQLMGINLVYLGVSEGVDAVAAEGMLRHQFDQAKAKAEEARQRALVAAERAKAAAQHARAAAPVPARVQPGTLLCPSCNSAITPSDAFCENCRT